MHSKLLFIALLLISTSIGLAGNNVILQWDASPDAAVSKYHIYEKGRAALTRLGTVDAPTLTFTVPNIGPGAHTYVVTAALPIGLESVPSNEATVPPAPGSPRNLRVLIEVTVQTP